jgi:hypothetical protein
MQEPNEIYTSEADYMQSVGGGFNDLYEEEIFANSDGESYFSESDLTDIDFSEFKGKDFKSKLKKVHKTLAKKKAKKPLDKEYFVTKRATLYGKKGEEAEGVNTKRIIVPNTQKVIVEGVDQFILNDDDKCGVKNIGYYKCKKLKELIFTINNNSGVDCDLNFFDPSMPLDYLYSTSGNLNNKIQVAGGVVSYSDVMFNILANPMHIVNAKFTFAGPTFQQQITQPLIFKNKSSTGEQKVEPMQLQLQVDNMQVANDIVFFDLQRLDRSFIPNGMDIIQYKVLAGNTVTFAFYYRQKDIRRLYYEEARIKGKLL